MATTGLVLKLTKTYRVHPDTYLLDCTLNLENRTSEEQKVQYDLTGPVGLEYEGLSTDMRNVVAAFRTPQGEVTSVRLTVQALAKATTPEKRSLTSSAARARPSSGPRRSIGISPPSWSRCRPSRTGMPIGSPANGARTTI